MFLNDLSIFLFALFASQEMWQTLKRSVAIITIIPSAMNEIGVHFGRRRAHPTDSPSFYQKDPELF